MARNTTTDLEKFVLAVITEKGVREKIASRDFKGAFAEAGLAPPTPEQVQALENLDDAQLRALAESFHADIFIN